MSQQYSCELKSSPCNTSHTQVSVSNAEEIELSLFFFCLWLPSGRQLALSATGHSAVTKGFQLCSAGLEGPLLVPFPSLHTEEPLLKPQRLSKASSHSSTLHTCGEFQANKFKDRVVVYPEKHSGVCKRFSGIALYALCPNFGPGNKVPPVQLVGLTSTRCRGREAHILAEMITVYSFTALGVSAALCKEWLCGMHAQVTYRFSVLDTCSAE